MGARIRVIDNTAIIEGVDGWWAPAYTPRICARARR